MTNNDKISRQYLSISVNTHELLNNNFLDITVAKVQGSQHCVHVYINIFGEECHQSICPVESFLLA